MSRGVLALLMLSLRRIGAILLGVGLLLASFEFLLTQVAAYLFRRNAFDQLSMLVPEFVRSVAGPSMLSFMSFTGIVTFGYFHPMVISAVVGLTIVIASEPAGEVERRFVDLTLSRTVTRGDVMIRTLLLFTVATVFLVTVMSLGTALGLACCAPPDAPRPAVRLIASLAASLATVMVCWAGITLAVASVTRRRAAAGGIVGVTAVAAYLLDYLGRAWDPARPLSAVSPFHYFEPSALVAGQALDFWNVMVLLGIGIAGSAIGFVVFSRRDI